MIKNVILLGTDDLIDEDNKKLFFYFIGFYIAVLSISQLLLLS